MGVNENGAKTSSQPVRFDFQKDIFSFKEVFLNFLKSTIKRPWVDKIDPQSLEFVDRSFVKDEFVEKEVG